MNTSSDLKDLLQASDQLSKSFQELKHSLISKTPSNSSPTHYMIKAMEDRQILRLLAETLQRNRKILECNKEKYEKSRTFLQGLEYYKATMKEKIKEFEISVEDADDYVEEKIGEIDWEHGYEEGQQKIKKELQKIISKTEEVKKAKEKKKELEKFINERKALYQKVLPAQMRRLNQEVVQTCKLFGIEHFESLEDIENPKLSKIWDNLKVLQKSSSISLKYAKEEYESIIISLKPLQYLPYTLCENKSNYFCEGKQLKLPLPLKLQQKQVVIELTYLSGIYNGLVIGIDRHSGFSNFQVFHRLINDEQAKQIFTHPEKQIERNFNSKYITTDWLQNLMICGLGEDILMSIRQRIWVLEFSKSTVAGLSFRGEKRINENRISLISVGKIASEEYFKLVKVPCHITKSINSHKFNEISIKGSANKSIDHFKSLGTLLQKLNMQELLTPNLNRYYNVKAICFTAQSQIKVSFIIIVPYSYPKKQSSIKIYQLSLVNSKPMIPAQPELPKQIKDYNQFIHNSNHNQIEIEMLEESINLQMNAQIENLSQLVSSSSSCKPKQAKNTAKLFTLHLQLWKLFGVVPKLSIT